MFGPIPLAVLTLLTVCASQPSCPSGFTGHGSSCYIILNEVGTWLAGMDYCKAFGMSLAKVDDEDEHHFLQTFLRASHNRFKQAPDFWIAGSKLMSFEWVWVGTNQEITTFHWGPGEPNNVYHNEGCLSYYAIKNFMWNDEGCFKNGYPLCERSNS